MRLLLKLLLLTALTHHSLGQDESQSTYPEQKKDDNPVRIHRLVMERLRQRSGTSKRHREGTWGSWTPWAPCSRSCGGGVTTQSRDCVRSKRSRLRPPRGRGGEGGVKRCVGRYKRFQLCNPQSCPGAPTDFRREQCASFNRMPFNDRTYQWEPYYESLSSCALNCRAVGLSFYATLNQTVIDGTPCGAKGSTNICVSGKCMTVSCEGILGSTRSLDQCGVCGGDNSTCHVVEGSYTQATLPYGYNLLLTLPTGAANISVVQVAPSVNHLALQVPGGDYLLRGGRNNNGSQVNSVEAAGTIFHYLRHGPNSGDGISGQGPIEHPLNFLLYWEAQNPGVRYRYMLPPKSSHREFSTHFSDFSAPSRHRQDNPLNPNVPGGPASRILPHYGPVNDGRHIAEDNEVISQNNHRNKNKKPGKSSDGKKKSKKVGTNSKGKKTRRKGPYEWKVAGFTPCSKTCGGGIQSTHVICVRKKRSTEVPEQNCYSIPKPIPQKARCNLKACPPEWFAEEWSACSAECGLGVQSRKLSCRQSTNHGDTELILPDEKCTGQTDLIRVKVCERPPCDATPRWNTGDWSPCTAMCGLGTRKRRVTCMVKGRNVPHVRCKDERPSDQIICDMGSCATQTWFYSPWDENCSSGCGTGHERRRIYCNEDPLAIHKPSCDVSTKPEDVRECNSDKNCAGSWFTGEWSRCDALCGNTGQQKRTVLCVSWGRSKYRIETDETQCETEKPESIRVCEKTCDSQWFTSQWSDCSESCGSGVQRREVKCLDENMKTSSVCPTATKPDTRQSCEEECDSENTVIEEASDDNRIGPSYRIHQDNQKDQKSTKIESTNEIVEEYDKLAAARQAEPVRVSPPTGWCMDRMKNCHLVFNARLCRLKYYSKLCCKTCSSENGSNGAIGNISAPDG